MAELYVTVRLRPMRIGFLARPTDLSSVRTIMRCCACVWGGIYNPIIPVYKAPPKEWRQQGFGRIRSSAVGRGYIEFFEPDVFVESEKGLLEELGLGSLRGKHEIYPSAISLEDFLKPERSEDYAEPAFGLTIVDVLRDLYEKEQRFQEKKPRRALLVSSERGSAVTEAIFGVFPTQKHSDYFSRWYDQVFSPEHVPPSPDTWVKTFLKDGAETPLGVTRHGLDRPWYWYHDLVVHVFDPRRATDLLDLWNARLEPWPILPVPIDWFSKLEDQLLKVVKAEHRKVKGNPSGLMHHASIHFGRSIPRKLADEMRDALLRQLPKDCMRVAYAPRAIWIPNKNDYVHRDPRLQVTADEQRTKIPVKHEREWSTSFEALSPRFAARYGGRGNRWVNAVTVSGYGVDNVATVLPFNTFDRKWPHLGLGGEAVGVGREGWVFPQRFKNMTQHVSLLSMEEAIIQSLKVRGIEAKLSDPGHVAKQMLDHLGGLWRVHLLADLETLQLLNKMAGAIRRRKIGTDIVEETFEGRSALVQDWAALVSRRTGKRYLPRVELSEFTTRNVIRLGLQTACPNCQATNWHALTSVDYKINCERCLNEYEFPQASLSDNNRNWHYRVVGPFSVPDYGRGSYSVLLTLRLINSFDRPAHEMTFSTAMNLKFDGVECETDFVALRGEEQSELLKPPVLIFGEAKSLGQGELIKPKDLATLRSIGQKLPGAFLVVSVLRDSFTVKEKKLLQKFIKWARRPDESGRATNPVILLTGKELFFAHMVSTTWKELGEPFSKFSDFHHTRNLDSFAEATQILHAGMPSYYEALAAARRARSRLAKAEPPPPPGKPVSA